MLHVTLYQAPCIFQRQRCSRPNALAFSTTVPALNLAVRLWIVRGVRMCVMPEMSFFLPQLQPELTGNPTVVRVGAPVPLPPVIELAGGHAQPRDEPSDADLGLLRPAPDKIHD